VGGKPRPRRGLTLARAESAFLEACRKRSLGVGAVAAYAGIVGRFVASLQDGGVTHVGGIRPAHVEAFVAGYRTTYDGAPAAGTQRNLRVVVLRWLRWLMDAGHLPETASWKRRPRRGLPQRPSSSSRRSRRWCATARTTSSSSSTR